MRLYRALLHLYPREFRQRYGEELEADFVLARDEALADRRRSALLACWRTTILDFIWSVPREWLRTPWLASLALAAVAAVALFYYVVGRIHRFRGFARSPQPPESPELLLAMASLIAIPLALTSLLVIARRRVARG